MDQNIVYYIGGPWDLHKVAVARKPDRMLLVRVLKGGSPLARSGAIEAVDYEYRVAQMGASLYVAIYQGPQP